MGSWCITSTVDVDHHIRFCAKDFPDAPDPA